MNCPTCGKENRSSARFCGICGKQLPNEPAPPNQSDMGLPIPMVGFKEAIISGFKNYLNFSGRATRAEYWWWQLFYFLVLFSFMFIAQIESEFLAMIFVIVWLGLLIPSFSLAFRRLHDCGKSALWLLIAIIPFGPFVLLIFLLLPSDYDNRYGPDPRITRK